MRKDMGFQVRKMWVQALVLPFVASEIQSPQYLNGLITTTDSLERLT